MNVRVLENQSASWKSLGNLFLKKGTNTGVHTFSSLFGSALDERMRNKLHGVTYLVPSLARQWIKEQGIILICV